MAQKPDKFPDWATEEEIDEVSGQANFVEPPDIRKESGWTRREIPPRQWFNWLARKTGLWFRWVEDRVEGLQYASEAEALAGEAEDRVLAPARFGDQSLTTNGYQVLPGGLILQWGSLETPPIDSVTQVTLPITYPNGILNVQCNRDEPDTGRDKRIGAGIVNNSTIEIQNSATGGTRNAYWMTIGH